MLRHLRQEGTRPWTTFNTKSMLGEALAGQKQYAAAEPLLVQGYEGMKQREAKMPPQAKDLRLQEVQDGRQPLAARCSGLVRGSLCSCGAFGGGAPVGR